MLTREVIPQGQKNCPIDCLIICQVTFFPFSKMSIIWISNIEPRWGKATFQLTYRSIPFDDKGLTEDQADAWKFTVRAVSILLGIPCDFSSFCSDNVLTLIEGRSSIVRAEFNIYIGWNCYFIDGEGALWINDCVWRLLAWFFCKLRNSFTPLCLFNSFTN